MAEDAQAQDVASELDGTTHNLQETGQSQGVDQSAGSQPTQGTTEGAASAANTYTADLNRSLASVSIGWDVLHDMAKKQKQARDQAQAQEAERQAQIHL